jgi:hypothetical protein
MINPMGAWTLVTSNETFAGAVMTVQFTAANTTIPVRTSSNSNVGAFMEISIAKEGLIEGQPIGSLPRITHLIPSFSSRRPAEKVKKLKATDWSPLFLT